MNKMKVTTLCAAMLVVGLAGCDGNDDDLAGSPDLVPPAATGSTTGMPPAGTDMSGAGREGVLTVASASDGGTYLADSAGNAVYMLETDGANGVDACVGDCLETWPPVLVTDVQPSVDVGAGLDASLLGTVERDDGTLQMTYAGAPLYRYAADTGANRTAGHDLEDQWGEWYLVTPAGTEFDGSTAGTTADATMMTDADGRARADSSVAEDATRDDGPADTSAIEEGTGDDY